MISMCTGQSQWLENCVITQTMIVARHMKLALAILKNCQCIQILNVLYVNLIVLFLSFFFSVFLQNLLHNFRSKQCKGTMSYQLSIKSFTQLKKHLLSLKETLKMRHHHYHHPHHHLKQSLMKIQFLLHQKFIRWDAH